jgi:hypothetical protein
MSWVQDRRNQAQKKLRQVKAGKLLQRTDPLATSFHEAGHAVFAEGFGMSVLWATCCPLVHEGEKLLGFVKSEEGAMLNGPVATVHALVGDIAEYPLLFGHDYEFGDYVSNSDGEDLLQIWEACNVSSPEQALSIFKNASGETADLIHQTEHWIDSIAIEMYAHKTIQGEQIRAILKEKNFYTPQNPLLQFYLYCSVMRLLAIGQMGGIKLPGKEDGSGSVSTETVMRWLLDNAVAMQSLLTDKNASWNQQSWGRDVKKQLSDHQIEQMITHSDILKKFGVEQPAPVPVFIAQPAPLSVGADSCF